MANQLDSFSAQIVNYVRTGMSDEAILELVKNKLGLGEEVAAAPAKARPSARAAAPAAGRGAPRGRRKKTGRKAKAKKAAAAAAPRAARPAPARKTKAKAKAGRKKAGRRAGGNRGTEMEAVERVIKSSKGLSASEISSRTKIPQSRVSAHVRALKNDKRIFQGGDRRFARYAGDQKTAEQASQDARKNAAGPRRS